MASTKTRGTAAASSRSNGAVSKAQWEALGTHRVTLFSGAEVDVRIPDLTILMHADAVPGTLREAALEVLNRDVKIQTQTMQALAGVQQELPALTYDDVVGMADLRLFLVSSMLVSPRMTVEELQSKELPPADLSMLMAIATRERDTDALGRRLSVAELSDYGRFLLVHECYEGCPECAAKQQSVSDASARQV